MLEHNATYVWLHLIRDWATEWIHPSLPLVMKWEGDIVPGKRRKRRWRSDDGDDCSSGGGGGGGGSGSSSSSSS
jgi:hypothetical protein